MSTQLRWLNASSVQGAAAPVALLSLLSVETCPSSPHESCDVD